MKRYTFDALIQKHPTLDSAFVEFPYSVEQAFGTKGRVKVRVHFDDYLYRGSLARMGHHCHIIGLNQQVRKAIAKGPGDTVHVVLQKDEQARVVDVPADLKSLLDKEKEAAEIFYVLSYTHQKEYVQWITSAKKDDTRTRRLHKTIDMLKQKIRHP